MAFDYDIYVNFFNLFMLITRYNWMTPRSRAVFEKLTGCWLVKKFPACCTVPKFITVHTTDLHQSLSWVKWLPRTSNLQQNRCENLKYVPWNQWPSLYFQKVSSEADLQKNIIEGGTQGDRNNLSDPTMALGATQSLTAMKTKNISWWLKAAGA